MHQGLFVSKVRTGTGPVPFCIAMQDRGATASQQAAMAQVMTECARVLRPGAFCTVVVGTNNNQLGRILGIPPEEVTGPEELISDWAVTGCAACASCTDKSGACPTRCEPNTSSFCNGTAGRPAVSLDWQVHHHDIPLDEVANSSLLFDSVPRRRQPPRASSSQHMPKPVRTANIFNRRP